ncbi:hypothetical protein PI125_g9989 [Phytophthora idaei]|nr:hypothetical protein PI125_g9989 [Phytophthora idaei]
MPKLRTIKGRAILRRGSHLSLLLLRNDTRWPSTYEMVERYVKHQLLIVQLGYDLLVEHDVIKQYTVQKPRFSATATIVNNTNLEQDWSSYSAERR